MPPKTAEKTHNHAAILMACSAFIITMSCNARADKMSIHFSPEVGFLIFSDLSTQTASLLVAGANLTYAARGERPAAGWVVSGWVATGLNAAAGVAYLGIMIDRGEAEDFFPWFCASHFVLAGLNLGFVIWASSQPEKPELKMEVAPVIIPDNRGNAAFGVGLRLVDW